VILKRLNFSGRKMMFDVDWIGVVVDGRLL
jgi:hypothetical protein